MTRAEILNARAEHPICGPMRFELARQDRREYFRLLIRESGGGSLTDEKHARLTVEYWQARGWTITTTT